jgi:hypothetical protein
MFVIERGTEEGFQTPNTRLVAHLVGHDLLRGAGGLPASCW